ncbi:MAG TPA: histidine kinase dimerization/phospho-acceptor domain-containing protein, partial [Bacteroidales bacterium]
MKTPTFQNFSRSQTVLDSAILSVLPFPALVFNVTTFSVLKSNSFFCSEKDYSVTLLLDKYGFDFLDNDDFHKIVKALYSNQNYIAHKLQQIDDQLKTYDVHIYLLPDGQNAFLYLNLLSSYKSSDLDFPEGLHQGLAGSDSIYKFLMDKLPLGIYHISKNGRFIYANLALMRILEYDSVEELYTLKFTDIFCYEDSWQQLLDRWNKSMFSTEEVPFITKNGRVIYVRSAVTSVKNKNGDIIFFCGIIEDMRDNIQRDLSLENEKTEETNILKATFLTNISHEIRTPMNSILGFSSMLKRKGLNYQKRQQYVDIILS